MNIRTLLLAILLSVGVFFPAYGNSIDGVRVWPAPENTRIVFDLSNNLKSLKAGNFTLSGITFGDSSILTNLPAWPETKIEESEKFDFPLLLKIIKVVSDLVAS